MKVLGSRVDGLTLRYRVDLFPEFVEALRESQILACKHGRAGFEWDSRRVTPNVWGDGDVLSVAPMSLSRAGRSLESAETTRAMWGELRYQRAQKRWNLTNQPFFRMQIDAQAAGAEDRLNPVTKEVTREPGWTIEIIFYAQWLAEIGIKAALHEGEALAALCGEVHETALGRIDLCTDIEGWAIEEADVKCLVKRPRARWQKEYGEVAIGEDGEVQFLSKSKPSKAEKKEAIGAQDFGRGALDKRQITGLSVGRGGAMMSRIYDKCAELERDEERRVNEERRWRHDGSCPELRSLSAEALRELDEERGQCPHCQRWDGHTRVSRIEFQIRGSVVREFGIRDPWTALEVELAPNDCGRKCAVRHKPMVDPQTGEVLGLVDRLDWLWRSCLDWVRLVVLDRRDDGTLKPASRLELDPRWAFLRTVTFDRAIAPNPIKRFRVRAAASAAMGLGVALAQAGRDGELEKLPVNSGAYDERTAHDELVARVTKLKREEALKIVEHLLKRGGGAIGACVHFAVRNNAALLRFRERSAHADLATGPPHGDGPRSTPTARGYGDDSTGGREAVRAVA